jgi:hypothetical protein
LDKVVQGRQRQTAFQRRLPRRRLTLTGQQAVSEDNLFDVSCRNAGARDSRLDRYAAQIRGGQRREVAQEPPDRRPCGGNDDNRIVMHVRWFPGGR